MKSNFLRSVGLAFVARRDLGGCPALAMAKFIACLITYAATAWTPPASAADRHWLGSTSPFLSEPSNWDPPGPLQNGDALIFDHNSNTSMNNDTVGLTFDHVAFRNYDFQINGNPLTLAPATIGDAEIDNSDEQDHHHSATINCDLVLGADAMFQTLGQSTVTCFLNFCNDGTMNTYLNGAIDLNGHNLTLEVEASFISSPPNEWVCPAAMYLSNSLEGTGNVTAIINGPAQANSTLEFNGSVGNTYRGYLRLLAQGAVVDFNKTSGVVVNDRLILDSASVELLGPQQVGPNASVEINGGGSLYCDADQTIGSLSITNGSGNTTGTWVTTGSHVLALNGNLTCATDNTNNSSFITGNLNLNGYLTFEINGINPTALWLGAVITGNGFVKTGNGTMSIGGNNTYWGDTEIQAGTIAVGNTTGTTPFGQSAQPSFGVHLEGGNIVLQNVSVGAQPLFVSTVSQGNSFLTAIGQCGWAGPVSLDATLNVIAADPTASGQFTDFSGPISGSGGLYLAPALLAEGAVQLSGSSANTFTGPTAVDCPLLKLAKPTGVAALSGPLIVGDDGFAAEVRWLNAYQATGVPLTLYPQALVNLNNNNEDFHEVTFNGGEVDTGTGQFGIYAPVTVNPSPTSAVINGLLGLPAGADRYFNVGQGSSGCDLVVNAIMFGGAPYLHKQGPGTMCLTSANSYTGITIIENGILDVNNAAALGSVGAPTIIGTTGTLQLNGSGTMIQNFEMAGAGAGGTHGAIEVPAGSSYTLNGSILLDTATTFNVGAGGSLGLGSTLSGTGPVLKSGLGQMILGGSTGNTYSGDTLVHGGTLYLGKPSGVEAIPGNLVIGGGTAATTASARHLSSFTIVGRVTVNYGSIWDLNGFAEGFTVSALGGGPALTLNSGGSVQTLSGGIVYLPVGGDVVVNPGGFGIPGATLSGNLGLDSGPHHITVGQNLVASGGPQCIISATIGETSGGGSLEKDGPGRLVLTGNNTYSGVTTVAGGWLQVDGSQPGSGVLVNSGGTLRGTGTVGYIQLADGSTVAPGDSPGILNCGLVEGPSSGAATLQIELDGTTPGSGYSQLNAHGLFVSLSGIRLSASLNYASAVGDQFEIVNYGVPNPIIGTFNGLPQNGTLYIGSELFQISYTGGTGNDVVLSRQVTPPPPVLTIQTPTNSVLLSWQTNDPLFALEFSTDLNPTNWLPVTPLPVIIGTNNVVTNSAGGPQKFYRLNRPAIPGN